MTTYKDTSVTFVNGGGEVDLQGVEGVEQLVNGIWQGNTKIKYPNKNQTATLRIFSNYSGKPIEAAVYGTMPSKYALPFGGFEFSNPLDWAYIYVYNNNTSLTRPVPAVTTVTTAYGSSDCIFSNGDTELEKFTIVPGNLNTEECANGSYDEITIKTIFNKLKNYIYFEDIFGQIRDKFASFYGAIALEQRIVTNIIELTQKLLAGEITIDQFNELVKSDGEIFAAQFAKDYVDNYVKLELAIQKYKYLLTE